MFKLHLKYAIIHILKLKISLVNNRCFLFTKKSKITIKSGRFFSSIKKAFRRISVAGSIVTLFLSSLILQAIPVGAANCNGYSSGTPWTIGSGQSGCEIPSGDYTPSSFTIDSGVTVYFLSSGASGVTITTTGDININGTLDGDGRGYSAEQGTGKGDSGSYYGGGGGYGGNGGSANGGLNEGGDTYGDMKAPLTPGSGGGNTGGGAGGGAIKLDAGGTLTIGGSITADGDAGTSEGGAGSGGAIFLETATLSGSGSVTANGGSNSADAGGGGGGRISITATTDNSTITKQASGGQNAESGGVPESLHVIGTGGSGGTSGSTPYTVSGVVTVTPSASTYNNGNYYYLKYLFGGTWTASFTQFYLTNSTGNQTLHFNFDSAFDMSKIRVYPYSWSDRWSKYKIEVSLDNSTWTTVTPNDCGGYTHCSIGSEGNYFDYTVDGLYKYARFTLTQEASWGVTLNEIQFYDAAITSSSAGSGGAGTIYTNIGSQTNGDLLVDGEDNVTGDTTQVDSTTLTFDNVTVTGNANYIIPSSATFNPTDLTIESDGTVTKGGTSTLSLTTLTVESGGTLTHVANTTTKANVLDISATNVNIESGGNVSANGLGYIANYGTGKPTSSSGAASHGGNGNGASAGPTYGSMTEPVDLGSGGYTGSSSIGGGAIKIIASETLTVDGTISADSATEATSNAAGGSVWLDAATIAGTGTVTADGIASSGSTFGGGGGRVAIHYTGGNPSLWTTRAAGGSSGDVNCGGAGTVYLESSTQTNGSLILDNNACSDNTAETEQADATITVDDLTVRNSAIYVVPSGYTLNIDNSLSGGTPSGTLSVNSTGTLNFPNATTTIDGVNIINLGTIGTVTDLTLLNSTFDQQGTFGASLTDLTIDSGATYNINGTATLSLDSLTVKSGGTLTHSVNTDTGTPYVKDNSINISATDIDIQSGGTVSGEGKGYAGTRGPGYTSSGGGTAAHGGNGYQGYGTTYGSVSNPFEPGSGGNHSSMYGGGVIKLVASSTLTLNGTVNANGLVDGSGYVGGSGGSVWLEGATLSGSGDVTANGGYYSSTGVGGGGGRIAVIATTAGSIPSYTLEAYGCGSNAAPLCGAGTIYTKHSGQTNGDVLVDNKTSVTTTAYTTPVASASETFDDFTVRDGAIFVLPDGESLDADLIIDNNGTVIQNGTSAWSVESLTVKSGGILTHSSNTTSKSNSLNIEATSVDIQTGGIVSANTKGYSATNGPAGCYVHYRTIAHGGNSPTGAGVTYGSITEPVDLGCGGSDYAGGGAIKIVATGTMTLNGIVRSNGTGSCYDGASAGGSVLLQAGTFSGSAGDITADGASDTCGTTYSSGGRIALISTTSESIPSYTIHAYGGSYVAGAGTIYTKVPSQTNGELLVDSNNTASTTTQPTSSNYTFDAVTIRKGAKYILPSSATLSVASTGTLTGGGSTLPYLTAESGSTLNLPTAATISDLFLEAYAIGTTTDLTVGDYGTVVQYGTSTWNFNSVIVESGGDITHGTNTSSKANALTISAPTINVNSGGNISATSKGYSPNNGPSGCDNRYGSAYASNGYKNNGTTYGSVTAPTHLGCGSKTDASGGGAIKLSVSDTLTINGTVSSTGGGGCLDGSATGGSIWIEAATLAGTSGTISANGGYDSCDGSYSSGGRVAIISTSSETIPNYTLEASGGSDYGGAGTIYTEIPSQTNGSLLIDSSNVHADSGVTVQVSTTSQTYDSVTIRDGARYTMPSGTNLTVNETLTGGSSANPTVTVNSGAVLTLNDVDATGDLTLVNSGSLGLSGNMTLANGTFNTDGTITGGLTRLTVESGGTFTHGTSSQLFSGSDLIIESGGTFVQEGTDAITVGTLDVQSGGTLTHADNSTSQANIVNLSVTTATVSGTINANYLGFDSSEGTGAGADGVYGSGGAHCGYGGRGHGGSPAQNTTTYGDEDNPITIGSGGGDDTDFPTQQGGAGGGMVKLVVSGTLTVTGSITADGQSAHLVNNTYQGGGGSGGSVNLSAGTIAGDGTISADGGDGSPSTATSYGGGGGGAGYVYINYAASTYTGSTTATGGDKGGNGGSSTAEDGEDCVAVLFATVPTIDSVDEETDLGDPVPLAKSSTVISVDASHPAGVSRVDIYIDGTDAEHLVGGCSYSPALTSVTCSVDVGILSQGYHTRYVKVTGADATEGTDTTEFRIAGETRDGQIRLSTLQKGATQVDFTFTFTLVATQPSGTLSITFPAGFTVTKAATDAGSSNCFSNFGYTSSTLTATKTNCAGTLILAGAQITNPPNADTYTVNWDNDFGWAEVIILDSSDIDIYATVDPIISFLAVAQSAASTCAPSVDLTGSDYLLDLGSLNVLSLTESEGTNADSQTVERICTQGSTNASSGMVVTVNNLNGTSGLVSTSVPADKIPSDTTGAISSGDLAYGLCVVSASLGSDDNLTPTSNDPTATGDFATYNCAAASGNVVSLDGTTQGIWSTSSVTQDATVSLWVRVAISSTTPAHSDYTDAVTFVATATY